MFIDIPSIKGPLVIAEAVSTIGIVKKILIHFEKHISYLDLSLLCGQEKIGHRKFSVGRSD